MTQRRIGWISTALAFFVVLTSSLFQAVSVSAYLIYDLQAKPSSEF